jgi:hypothetical protein
MRRAGTLVLIVLLGTLSGCLEKSQKSPGGADARVVSEVPAAPAPERSPASDALAPTATQSTSRLEASIQPASAERKVIRNAELTLELSDPAEGKRKIEAIAEVSGGFVVSSEATGGDEAGAQLSVTVILRIPAARFNLVLDQVRKVASRIRREKITGQDVTEEYIDLEARLKAKRAVEAQFLEIMKRANSVKDALEVQRALGEVRAEIEQVEGRRRFLENQVSLSTLTISLQTPASIVNTTGRGFLHSLREAFGEGFDEALGFILGFIRFVIVMIPFVVLVVLPAAWLWRRLRRNRRSSLKSKQAEAQPAKSSEP